MHGYPRITRHFKYWIQFSHQSFQRSASFISQTHKSLSCSYWCARNKYTQGLQILLLTPLILRHTVLCREGSLYQRRFYFSLTQPIAHAYVNIGLMIARYINITIIHVAWAAIPRQKSFCIAQICNRSFFLCLYKFVPKRIGKQWPFHFVLTKVGHIFRSHLQT